MGCSLSSDGHGAHPLHPDVRTVRLLYVCVCAGVSKTKFAILYRERVHQQNLGFYLSVCQRCPNYPNSLSVFASWSVPHSRITRQMHPPSLRLHATSQLTFFSPVIHFRWIYTVLLSSYNCHICVFGHFWNPPPCLYKQVICYSVHCTCVVRWEGVKNAKKCNCWFLFEKHSDVFNGADLTQQITKKNMMHPCRNIFKRPFFAIKLFKKCDSLSRVCFYDVFAMIA